MRHPNNTQMLLKFKAHPVTRYFIVIVIIPLCILAVLIPYSLLLKWNIFTLLLFWFIIVPFVVQFLTARLLRNKNTVANSMIALVSFYGFMVWMIYEHYQSDYFAIMISSFVWNLLIMLLVFVIDFVDRTSESRPTG